MTHVRQFRDLIQVNDDAAQDQIERATALMQDPAGTATKLNIDIGLLYSNETLLGIVNYALPRLTSVSHEPNWAPTIAMFLWTISSHQVGLQDLTFLAKLLSALPFSLSQSPHFDLSEIQYFNAESARSALSSTGIDYLNLLTLLERGGQITSLIVRRIIKDGSDDDEAPIMNITDSQVDRVCLFVRSLFDILTVNNGFPKYNEGLGNDTLWLNTWGFFWQGFLDGFQDSTGSLALAKLFFSFAKSQNPNKLGYPTVHWRFLSALLFCVTLDGLECEGNMPYRNFQIFKSLAQKLVVVHSDEFFANNPDAKFSLNDPKTFDEYKEYALGILIDVPRFLEGNVLTPIIKSFHATPEQTGKFVVSVWKGLKFEGTSQDMEVIPKIAADLGWKLKSTELAEFKKSILVHWGDPAVESKLENAFLMASQYV